MFYFINPDKMVFFYADSLAEPACSLHYNSSWGYSYFENRNTVRSSRQSPLTPIHSLFICIQKSPSDGDIIDKDVGDTVWPVKDAFKGIVQTMGVIKYRPTSYRYSLKYFLCSTEEIYTGL